MLAKCVLATPPRQGKMKKQQTSQLIRGRAQRWLNGERCSLWDELIVYHGYKRDKTKTDNAKFKINRCIELTRDGQFSKACKALVSQGIAEPSDVNMTAMREKHPLCREGTESVDLPSIPHDLMPDIPDQIVEKMIKSFRRGTAPGPSALRPQHLQDGLRSSHGDELLAHLTGLVNLCATGNAPQELRPFLAGASLIGLNKEDGGIRPIAIGEALRRLVAKSLCEMSKDDARQHLWPLQIGVSAPLGAEIGFHTVRQWWMRNEGNIEKSIC